jgi:hypothetical protein
VLNGCTSITRPYFELGAGVKLASSYVIDVECGAVRSSAGRVESCGGRNPTAHAGAGVEFKPGSSVARWVTACGWHHWSHWRDGWPRNDRRELHVDELVCVKRWGGYR